MAYTEHDITSLAAKLHDLDLTPSEAEVLGEILDAAGSESEVEGFGSRDQLWKPMIDSFLLPLGTRVIEYQDGTDFTSRTGYQDGSDL